MDSVDVMKESSHLKNGSNLKKESIVVNIPKMNDPLAQCILILLKLYFFNSKAKVKDSEEVKNDYFEIKNGSNLKKESIFVNIPTMLTPLSQCISIKI